jgi:hypothetical protein
MNDLVMAPPATQIASAAVAAGLLKMHMSLFQPLRPAVIVEPRSERSHRARGVVDKTVAGEVAAIRGDAALPGAGPRTDRDGACRGGSRGARS